MNPLAVVLLLVLSGLAMGAAAPQAADSTGESGELLNGSVRQSGAVTTVAKVEAGKVNGSAVPSRPAGARISVTYKGARIDVTSIQSRPDRDAIIDSIRDQIDLVDADIMDPRLRDFFFAVPLVAAENISGIDNATYTTQTRQVTLTSASFSRDKPILLHELMHAYHDQKLPGGFANAQMRTFFEQARASGRFPAGAYMLSSVAEYFAMMASVYVHGTAARDPFMRAAIREKQPEMYDWLVKEFGQR